jgi:hypothetical protein
MNVTVVYAVAPQDVFINALPFRAMRRLEEVLVFEKNV